MKLRQLDAPFGAEVLDLDLSRPLSNGQAAAVNAAFVENVVLCFRGQKFQDAEGFLQAVVNLGQPMPPVTATYRLPGYDVIEELSNRATDKRTGDEIQLRRGGSWHTDHSNLCAPPKATMLYAIELPKTGGNTEFINQFLAYSALDNDTKCLINGRRAFHAYLSRRAPRPLLTRTTEEAANSSGCWQPLVRRHPEAHRAALYLNPMRCDGVEGMSQADGDALLDRLYAHCDQPDYKYSHNWTRGDVLIWDNRSALHQAVFDFDQREHRYLYRAMLKGEPAEAFE